MYNRHFNRHILQKQDFFKPGNHSLNDGTTFYCIYSFKTN